MADGYISIETKLSTDKFDKQMAKLDEKVAKKEKEKIEIDAEIKGIKESEAEYEMLIKKQDEYGDKLIEAKAKVEQLTKARKALLEGGGLKASDVPTYDALRNSTYRSKSKSATSKSRI